MTDRFREFKTEIGGREVTVEIGKYAEQTNGSCVVRCGETVVMVNVTMAEKPREGMDYFPLGVDYEEKMYAVGKIPGGFKRREGRASDKAILTSRLIDRPLRPLFPKGIFNDVIVIATALSVDPDIAPEPLAMFGSSVALCISDIPFAGPTGSVVVGLVDGEYVINPSLAQREKSRLALNLAGTKDAIMMVEAGSKEISDDEMVGAILFGHEHIKKQCAFQEMLVKEVGKPKKQMELYHVPEEIDAAVRAFASEMLDEALKAKRSRILRTCIPIKRERSRTVCIISPKRKSARRSSIKASVRTAENSRKSVRSGANTAYCRAFTAAACSREDRPRC